MILQVLLMHCVVSLWKTRVDGLRNPDDPEPATQGPSIPSNLDEETLESRYQGLMFAGMTEFNWLVDVRTFNQDQETWSIGNILTYYHVLTTCRAITHSEVVFGSERVALKVIDDYISVYFSPSYLWNDSPYFIESQAIGSRTVLTRTAHQRCDPYLLLYDYGLLRLVDGIYPIVPLTGYMPIPGKWNKRPDFGLIKKHRMVCYIASYGKDYRNIQRPNEGLLRNMLKDHKIKFRVYYVDWKECDTSFPTICPSSVPACKYFHETIPTNNDILTKLMCFRPRKKVGAICDHDRGAPLVCNGFVYGMVVQGVSRENCHNMIQYPVIVLDTFDFIQDLNFNIQTGKWVPYSASQSVCTRDFIDTILIIATLVTSCRVLL